MKKRILNHSLRSYAKWLLTLFALSLANLSIAQQLSGTVTDAVTAQPLAGATINYGSGGTTTDASGTFTIKGLAASTVVLKVRFMGYQAYIDTLVLSAKPMTHHIKLVPTQLQASEVVITATRTQNAIKNIPARINLIERKQINSLPAHSIDELLTYIPGIQVSRPYGVLTSRSTVSLRGLGGKEQSRTLVLIDGIPVNKTDGGTVNWNLINNGNIERIEITKGPGSALYGGNAMGGVINVITRKPVKRLEGNASLEYSTYATPGASLNLGGRLNPSQKKGFYWNMNGFLRRSDGYITQPERDQTKYTIASDMQEWMGGLRLGYDFNDYRNLETDVRYYDDLRGSGEKVFQPHGNVTSYKTIHFRTAYHDKFGKYDFMAHVFGMFEDYQKVNEYMRDNSYTFYDVDSRRNDVGALLNVSRPMGSHHFFTAGIDLRRGSVDASDIYYTSTDKINNRGSMDFAAAYVQDEVNLLKDRMKIVAGIRFDYARFFDGSFNIELPSAANSFMQPYQIPMIDETDWNAISPRVALQYRLTEAIRAYASYSRGFRPSVLDDMCRSGRIKGGFKVANPALQPEILNNYEAGFDYAMGQRLTFNASVYYAQGLDFMYYTSTGQTIDMGYAVNPVSMRKNISEVEIYGVETEITFKLTEALNVFANYAYTHSKIADYIVVNPMIDVDLSGKYLTDVAPHLFSAGANFSWNWLSASVFCKYTDKMWINDYNGYDDLYLLAYQYPSVFVMDARLGLRFSKYLNASLSGQNLLDKRFYDSKGLINPGRILTGVVTVSF